jgi:hypothetical protein
MVGQGIGGGGGGDEKRVDRYGSGQAGDGKGEGMEGSNAKEQISS